MLSAKVISIVADFLLEDEGIGVTVLALYAFMFIVFLGITKGLDLLCGCDNDNTVSKTQDNNTLESNSVADIESEKLV